MKIPTQSHRAFTLVELLVVIAVLVLLVAIQFPVLAGTKSKVEVISCGDNLKRISVAFTSWASSHNERMPMSVPGSQGGAIEAVGTRATSSSYFINTVPSRRGVFGIFLALSNELTTPKILYCPAEYRANIAQGFIFGDSIGATNGFFNDNGTSYFVGVDAGSFNPNMMLTGDHNLGDSQNPPESPNIYGDTKSNFISAGTNLVWLSTRIGWADNQHRRQGNVNFMDGSVQNLDTAQFRAALNKTADFGRVAGVFATAFGSQGMGSNRLQFP